MPPLGSTLTVATFYDLPNGKYQSGHRGIDLPASPGTRVRSPTAGIVSFVGAVVDRPVLTIRTISGTLLTLEPIASDLQQGDLVSSGQDLGLTAAGGHCLSACLHLGVRINDEYVNPLRYFRSMPVLVPW